MIQQYSFKKIGFLLFSIHILLSSFSQAQEIKISQNKENFLTGIIKDSETKNPIPHVEVFITGTTSGCITDSLGNFKLKIPFYPCVLVADHVSYEAFIKPLETNEKIKIELTPSNFSLREVNVSGKNKRKKNLRFFYSHFIRENRNKIEILNDSVLVFQRDKMKFIASSNEALILVNSLLGYKIRVVLEEFEVIALDSPNGKQIPLKSLDGGEVMQLTGFYFYEPLDEQFPDKKEYYEQNRRTTYYGSYRHFLKSIYDNDPENQGYLIEVSPPDQEAAFYEIENMNTVNTQKEFVIMADTLNITYHFDDKKFPIPKEEILGRNYFTTRKSVIYPTSEPFYIRENGTSPKLTFIIDGLMVIKSFANSLPEDYQPPKR